MKVLFCHDGPICCDTKGRYYSIGFNDKLFERYSEVFEQVSFVTRVERTDGSEFKETDKLSVSKYPVIEYPNYLNIKGLFTKKRDSKKMLEEKIANVDVLIIRLPSFLGSECVKIARKLNKPYLIELVGCPWDSLRNHGLSGKLLAPYMYLKTKYQVSKATDVLYVTNDFLQKRYPSYGNQIGCSDVELLPSNDDLSLERKTVHNEKMITVGTIGKIDLKYKGHATVIRAIKLLKNEGYKIKYEIVGPGSTDYLKNIAESVGVLDQVVFKGSMGHKDVFKWLDTIDVYIQPSLTEGMPRSLIEAMSRGCPCIASNAGGMPELLNEDFIFSKGDSKALANILLNTNKNGLYKQSNRNKEFTKKFSPEIIKQKRYNFYNTFKIYNERKLNDE